MLTQRGRRNSQQRRRRALGELEQTPGLVMLVIALVIVGVVLWVSLSAEDDQVDAATPGRAPASAAGTSTTAAGITLDPHAGVQVLNPRSFPPAPADPTDAAGKDAASAAAAFAAQACALNAGESRSEYEQRLTLVASAQVAAAWEVGSALRIACLQLAAAITQESAAAADVYVTGVQVYADPDAPDGMRAHRWSAELHVKKVDEVWQVSG